MNTIQYSDIIQNMDAQFTAKEKKNTSTHNKYTVAVRIRPSLSNSSDTIFTLHEGKKVRQLRPKSIVTYSFDEVFEPQHSNEHIFSNSIKKKIQHFIENKVNTTILAYGQTGSGKTHTLFGHKKKENLDEDDQEPKQKGMCQYILEQVVSKLIPKKEDIYCSFLQIYKEKVTDLLTSKQVTLRENSQNQLILSQRTVIKVESIQKILQTLKIANGNKIFGNSCVHSESSRSHVVFILQLKDGSSLNIVDLCGSQVLTYKFDEKQREETNSINLSLFTLNAVINDLCEQTLQKDKNKFIGFRNSVLTRLLKKSLIDEKKTQIYLFCNIAPEQKHRAFSVSTLKFGQTAISIDQCENTVEEKINLSQQKRDLKKVDNIIDISPKPNQAQMKRLKWQVYQAKIFDKKTIVYSRQAQNSHVNILFLHAYGYGCSGYDWDYFIPYILNGLKANIYSLDFPGFGMSEGKKFTSRAEDFACKGQSLQFLMELFKLFKFNPKNKTFLAGYDLGGAIALSSAFHQNLKKSISGVIAFHPTWTDKIEKLALITLPVQLIWFPIQNFHLISAGQKMSKVIKQSKLYRLNVGSYSQQKAAGYYDLYSDTIGSLISEFIKTVNPIMETTSERVRGKIQQQVLNIGSNKEEQQLQIQRKAVSDFYSSIKNKTFKTVFDSIIKGGEDKPKYVRLASELPLIEPGVNIQNLIKWGYFQFGTICPLKENIPLFAPGRQVHIETNVNLSTFEGEEEYLTYSPKGEKSTTHRAYICAGQKQDQIIEKGQIQVSVDSENSKIKKIKVDLGRTIQLNSETIFRNVSGNLIFQDNVTCKYSSLVTKLMLARCCHAINEIIPKINLSQNTQKTLDLQKQCSRLIFQQMDLRHLVHEGIDNTRFTGIDVGRLAYYGQGNCHHLASTLAALLLPFSRILGWEVIFRAGSFFMTGRDIDQNGNPLKSWNGKPNTKIQDHTWLQIVYKPSLKTFVMDPSFSLCSEPIDKIYTIKGKMHISGRKQCGSKTQSFSDYIYSDYECLK